MGKDQFEMLQSNKNCQIQEYRKKQIIDNGTVESKDALYIHAATTGSQSDLESFREAVLDIRLFYFLRP